MSCKALSNDKISNKDFLEMMIKHNNVSIRLSNTVLQSSDNDFILDYARRIKDRHSDQSHFMSKLLKSLPAAQMMPNAQMNISWGFERYIPASNLDVSCPSVFGKVAACNDSDFDDVSPYAPGNTLTMETKEGCVNNIVPKETIADCDYVTHMFSHHNSAIMLAKLLLKSTKEPRMFVLGQTIVEDQNKEMFELNYLKNNLYNWKNMIPQTFCDDKL